MPTPGTCLSSTAIAAPPPPPPRPRRCQCRPCPASPWDRTRPTWSSLPRADHRRSRASRRPPVSTYHRSAAVLLLACAEGRPRSHVALLATGVEVSDDPEVNYFSAGHLAYCGETEA